MAPISKLFEQTNWPEGVSIEDRITMLQTEITSYQDAIDEFRKTVDEHLTIVSEIKTTIETDFLPYASANSDSVEV